MNIDLLFSNFDLFNTPEKIQKLKQAILQLAVKGKLVPQDPNDEPASELIQNIKAKKARLAKEGKIKKEKALSQIPEEEIPYVLPAGWEWVRVGTICTVKGGKRVPRGYQLQEKPTDHIYIRIADMKNGSVEDSNLRYVSDEIFEKIKQYIIEKDDLYITIAGTIGQVGEVPGMFHKMNLTENAARIILFNTNKIFIKYALSSGVIQEQFKEKVNKMAQPKLALHRIESTIFPLPPFNEQKRIVEKVDELFSRADEIESNLKKADQEIVNLNKSALNQLLESKDEENLRNNFEFIAKNFDLLYSDERSVKELRQAILQLAVQGKLVPQDPRDEPASKLIKKIKAEKEKLKKEKPLPPISEDEIPYELPTGWEWVRLGEITNFGITYKVDKELLNDNTWILYLEDIEKVSSKLLRKARYSERRFKSSSNQFQIGDVLYGKLRPYLDKVVVADEPGICSGEILPIRSYYGIDSSYLRLTLKRPDFIDYVNDRIYGTKMPRLGTIDGKMALIPLAPTSEQKRIVEKIEQLMKFCGELESRISKSKEKSERLIGAILSDPIDEL